ncbi:MAG: hypothetical protein PHQ53_06685 [Candidatus Krumholzibacteria bacterium]|nr:hypothetical protein [Candidatus Krumholzibacteria bacterium]
MNRHAENLRLLAIFHFVYAGLILLGSLVPVFWLLVASLWWPELAGEIGREPAVLPVAAVGALGLVAGGFAIILAWVWVGVVVAAGRSLLARRRHTFCMVVAAVACLQMPLGTLLGVASLILLNQDGVRALFAEPDAGRDDS